MDSVVVLRQGRPGQALELFMRLNGPNAGRQVLPGQGHVADPQVTAGALERFFTDSGKQA